MKQILILLSFLSLVGCGQMKPSSTSELAAMTNQNGAYVYTSNPDAYAKTGMEKIFKNMSDTGRSEVTECYRRIDRQDLIQIVCKGKVEVLVFGGHRSWAGAACRYDFNRKPNGQYLTTRTPECTK